MELILQYIICWFAMGVFMISIVKHIEKAIKDME